MVVAAQRVLEAFDALPQVARQEVLDEMLRRAALEHELTQTASAASANAFQKVWANPEDDAYDAL